MTAIEKQDFLKKNKDAFDELSRIMSRELNLKYIDPSQYTDYELEVKARRHAVKMVEEWIGKVFTSAYAYEDKYTEEESVYHRYDSELRKENRDN